MLRTDSVDREIRRLGGAGFAIVIKGLYLVPKRDPPEHVVEHDVLRAGGRLFAQRSPQARPGKRIGHTVWHETQTVL